LQVASKSLDINDWLTYFASVIVAAQEEAINTAEFVIKKGRFIARHIEQLNVRQLKVLNKMLASGCEGFVGGMSAEKYINITRASRATATRDLNHLHAIGALFRTGSGKGTRYHLHLA
jgi:Fic family protein